MPHKCISSPERDAWIAQAAFYRAEKRGFKPGFALEDWLAAETLIDFEIARNAHALSPYQDTALRGA